jgi:hypothetical protein
MELLRVRFDEQARGEKRKSVSQAIESGVTGTLKPWREVVMPHEDGASGRYQQAKFAADLWQVHLGEGTAEYRDPVEFFRRTDLTESLKRPFSLWKTPRCWCRRCGAARDGQQPKVSGDAPTEGDEYQDCSHRQPVSWRVCAWERRRVREIPTSPD